MNDQKCKHGGCHCKGSEVGANGYCSDACSRGEMKEGKCSCGHPDCR